MGRNRWRPHAEHVGVDRLDLRALGELRNFRNRRGGTQTHLQGAAATKLLQPGDAVVKHHFSTMENLHAIANRFDLGKDMGRQDQTVIAPQVA